MDDLLSTSSGSGLRNFSVQDQLGATPACLTHPQGGCPPATFESVGCPWDGKRWARAKNTYQALLDSGHSEWANIRVIASVLGSSRTPVAELVHDLADLGLVVVSDGWAGFYSSGDHGVGSTCATKVKLVRKPCSGADSSCDSHAVLAGRAGDGVRYPVVGEVGKSLEELGVGKKGKSRQERNSRDRQSQLIIIRDHCPPLTPAQQTSRIRANDDLWRHEIYGAGGYVMHLCYLYNARPLTVAEFAASTSLSRSTCRRILYKMETAGYATRAPQPGSRRGQPTRWRLNFKPRMSRERYEEIHQALDGSQYVDMATRKALVQELQAFAAPDGELREERAARYAREMGYHRALTPAAWHEERRKEPQDVLRRIQHVARKARRNWAAKIAQVAGCLPPPLETSTTARLRLRYASGTLPLLS